MNHREILVVTCGKHVSWQGTKTRADEVSFVPA